MGFSMVPLYVLKHLLKNSTHPYTQALQFVTRDFQPLFLYEKHLMNLSW